MKKCDPCDTTHHRRGKTSWTVCWRQESLGRPHSIEGINLMVVVVYHPSLSVCSARRVLSSSIEALSILLAEQTDNDEWYTLDEKMIISQVRHRDNLLEKIQVLEQELAETKKRPRSPHTLMLLQETRMKAQGLQKPPWWMRWRSNQT